VFAPLKRFHFRVTRWLINVNVSVRLLALTCLGASVAPSVTALGIPGLAASKQDLRSVYEDRTVSVQQFAKISSLTPTDTRLLQISLSEVRLPSRPVVIILNLHSRLMGMVVDRVSDVIKLSNEQINTDYLVDIDSLLPSTAMRLIEKLAACHF